MNTRFLLAAAIVALSAPCGMASPITIVDTTPGSATNDGIVNVGEYVGFSNGINPGNLSPVGLDSELHIDSSASGDLNIGLRRGAAFLFYEVVIYIDSVAGGFADTTTMSDTSDKLRSAISGDASQIGPDAELYFAPTFLADYAIAFHNADSVANGLWKLAAGGDRSLILVKDVNLTPSIPGFLNSSPTAEMNLSLADLEVAPGGSFRYVLTYVGDSGVGLYRYSTYHGVSASTIGPFDGGPVDRMLAAGDFNTFQSVAAVPEPQTIALAAMVGLFALAAPRRRLVPEK